MKSFDEVYGRLIKLNDDREKGIFHNIPLPFSRLTNEHHFYGFAKKQYVILTAGSGIGKTHLTKYIAVLNTYFFCKKHNIDFAMDYFALEEDEDQFGDTIIAYLLSKLGYRWSASDLKYGRSMKEIQTVVKQVERIYEDMRKYIRVIDNVSNPTGIYKEVKKRIYQEADIKHIKKDNSNETYTKLERFHYPYKFYFVVIDHVGLVSEEKGLSQWETIGRLSKYYINSMLVKRLGCTVILVQQQESTSDKKQFTNRGEIISESLEPSTSGLANNKETQREAQIILGLFSPFKSDLEEFHGFPISPYKDHIRFLKVLKDRWYGSVNKRLPLLFDGAVSRFAQMPKLSEINNHEALMDKFMSKYIHK